MKAIGEDEHTIERRASDSMTGASPNEDGPKLRSSQGETTPRTSRAQGDSEPTPTPPRRGALSGPLLGGVGVGRFMERGRKTPQRACPHSEIRPSMTPGPNPCCFLSRTQVTFAHHIFSGMPRLITLDRGRA